MSSRTHTSVKRVAPICIALLLLLTVGTLASAAHLSRVYTSDAPVLIPDFAADESIDTNAVSSTLTVSSDLEGATCSNVIMRLLVDHPTPYDLAFWLIAPDGQRLDLYTYPSMLSGGWFSVPLPSPSQIEGDWTLYVSDTWEDDEGTLLEWNLVLPYDGAVNTAEIVSVSGANTEPIAIPDHTGREPGMAMSTIDLSGIAPEGARALSARVEVEVDHTAASDLSVVLVTPDGRQVVLHDLGFYLDSTSSDTVAPIGSPIAGEWRLLVYDNALIDSGELLEWRLEVDCVTTPSVPLFTDAASIYPLHVPDLAAATVLQGVTSTITVSNIDPDAVIAGTIFTYFVRHNYPSDLVFTLSKENGPEVVFGDGLGANTLSIFINAYDGMSPLGKWTLRVADEASSDEGELVYWSLRFVLDYPDEKAAAERLRALTLKVLEHEYEITELKEALDAK